MAYAAFKGIRMGGNVANKTRGVLLWALCFIALTGDVFGTWLTNVYLYPNYLAVCPEARDVSSAVGVTVLIILALWALHKPSSIKESVMTPVALALYSLGFMLILMGLWQANAFLLVAGSAVRSVGSRWFVVLVGLALCRLDRKGCLLCVAAAFSASYLLRFPFGEGVGDGAIAVLFALGLATCLAARIPAASVLSAMASSEPARDASITQPAAYLPFAHTLFVAILLFRVAYGFALTFEAVEGVPNMTMLGLVPIALMLVMALLPRMPRVDVLYPVAALLVIAGFLGIIVLNGRVAYGAVVNGLLFTGSECFEMLMWFALASIGARNPVNALAVFAWGRAASSFGLLCGATVGHWTAYLPNGLETSTLVACVLFLFVAANLTLLKDFSFRGTIEGVAAAVPLRLAEVRKPSVDLSSSKAEGAAACGAGGSDCGAASDPAATTMPESKEASNAAVLPVEAVSAEFKLTPRETEILSMLAHGRNAPYIQEKLVLSRNTVKTHVQNIYAKLQVHSQQELIDVVESFV